MREDAPREDEHEMCEKEQQEARTASPSRSSSDITADGVKRSHTLEHCDDSSSNRVHTQSQQNARCDAYRFEVTLHKDVFGLGIYFAEADGCAIVDVELPFYRLPDDAIGPGEASGVIAPGDVLCAIDGRALQGLRLIDVIEALRCIPIGTVTLAFERPMPRLVVVKSESQHQLADNQHRESDAAAAIANSNQLEDEREQSEQRSVKRWGVFQRLSSTAASLTGSSSNANTSAALTEIAALQTAVRELEAALHTTADELKRERKCRFLAEKKNILYRNELLRRSDESASLRFQLAREAAAHTQREVFVRDHLHVAI